MSFYKTILSEIETLKNSCRPPRPHQTLKTPNSNYGGIISKNQRLRRIAESLHSPIRRTYSALSPSNSNLIPSKTARYFNNDYAPSIEYLQDLLEKEQAKNETYRNDIIILNRRIDELELALEEKGNDKIGDNELIKENTELKIFKESVFSLSKQYDEINENIIIALSEINRLFQKLNEKKFNMDIELKSKTLNTIQNNFENVIQNLLNTMKIKQDEYNLLLNEKEKDVQKILLQNDLMKKKHLQSQREFFEKTAWLLKRRRESYYNNENNHSNYDFFREYFRDKPDNILNYKLRKSESMKNFNDFNI